MSLRHTEAIFEIIIEADLLANSRSLWTGRAKRTIALLKVRRAALIAAAVTGQIAVPQGHS
jgi:hypothetical protein